MADEPLVIRGINWRETFPFTNIFRSFRIAIHPSKLVLALTALLLLYFGGRILDKLWPERYRAVPSEVSAYEGLRFGWAEGEARPSRDFLQLRTERRTEMEQSYASMLQTYEIEKDPAKARIAAHDGDHLGDLKDKIRSDRDKKVLDADKAYDEAVKNISTADANLSGEAKTKAEADKAELKQHFDDSRLNAIKAAYAGARQDWRNAEAIEGRGLFIQFFEYEIQQIDGVVNGILSGRWLNPGSHLGGVGTPADRGVGQGVLRHIANFFAVGPMWLMTQHTVYFILFALWFLIVWAIFGGAICRIAAIHVARDEKISVRQALRFSTGKFLSFICAPIIPLFIVLVVGLIVWLGGLVNNLWFPGAIIVSLLFFLALAAGFVMTLVLLGTAGGFNLMYPTIAVEGSDSFDAISRSFSYIYARPWRLGFYTLMALIYGSLTFLFVRFFVWLLLVLTHAFVGWACCRHLPDGTLLWDAMWPSPSSMGRLSYTPDFVSLWGPYRAAAGILAIWVYLTISMVGAYAISYYFSSNTIIYYLMRREVDATELDDVYLEEADEDLAEAAPVTAAQDTTATSMPAAPSVPEPSAPIASDTAAPLAPAPEPPADTQSPPPTGGEGISPPENPPA